MAEIKRFLRLLGVVCVATVLPWALAKAACNLRDSPIRQPHEGPAERSPGESSANSATEASAPWLGEGLSW